MTAAADYVKLPSAPGARICVYRPGRSVYTVASDIAEAAWSRTGVRVFAWPCGTIAYVRVRSIGEQLMLAECPEHLVGTWTRGARYEDVLADLRALRGITCA